MPEMTEAQWLSATDPEVMLRFLHGQAGDRKLRLFACACCRRLGPLLTDRRSRHAVEVAERFAEGTAGPDELAAARAAAAEVVVGRADHGGDAFADHAYPYATYYAHTSAARAATESAADGARASTYAARAASRTAATAVAWATTREGGRGGERRAQCALLRDLFNPFHPVTLDPTWLTPTVVSITRRIHDEADFLALLVLADALEEARCDDQQVLSHCRGPAEHVRGCWLIDLLLPGARPLLPAPADHSLSARS
jgi:hypothetical protein